MVSHDFFSIAMLFLFLSCASVSSADFASLPVRHINEHSFQNGFTLLREEMKGAELVNLSLLVKTGSANEGGVEGSGLTHLLEHLIFKERDGETLSSVVERVGGYTNAYTSRDQTLFTVTVPKEHWQKVLPSLIHAVFQPGFTEEDFQQEREVVLRELARYEDEPGYAVNARLWETSFKTHLYRFPIGGYPHILNALSYQDAVAYHSSTYTPDNAVLAVAGDIPFSQLRLACEEAVSGYSRTSSLMRTFSEEPAQRSLREAFVPFETDLCYLLFAWHATPMVHPDTAVLDLIASILGRGKSSRLYRALVEKGLAYAVSSYAYTPRDPGLFFINVVCKPEHANKVRKILFSEIEKAKKTFSSVELKRARTMLSSEMLFNLETVESRAGDIASHWALSGSPLYSERYLKDINTAKVKDLRAAALRYLAIDELSILSLSKENPFDLSSSDSSCSEEDPSLALTSFPNGTKVLLYRDAQLPIITFSVMMKGGQLYESQDSSGIFSLMANLLISGTPKMTGAKISEIVAEWGGRLSPYSGNNSFGINLSLPSSRWKEGLTLLADIVGSPSFPENEIAREKEKKLGAIIARDENALLTAEKKAREALFASHPYGFPSGGSKESLSSFSAAKIRSLYQRFLSSKNMVITAFGDFHSIEIEKEIQRLFGKISDKEIPEPEKVFFSQKGPREFHEILPKREAVVFVGYPGFSVTDRDRPVLELLRGLLNQQNGILFQRLREKEPLVYASGFSYFLGLQPGMNYFYAQCNPENSAKVCRAWEEVVSSLISTSLSEEVLEEAKAKVVGGFRISRQTLSSKALDAGLSELYGLGYNYSDLLEKKVLSLTSDDVKRFAQKAFAESGKVTVVVAP
ncbi:MAG: pitrilysin family protein [Candidatus Ratteibacteria bacterium]